MKIGEVIRWRSTPVQNTRKWTLINNICGGEVIVFWVFWSFFLVAVEWFCKKHFPKAFPSEMLMGKLRRHVVETPLTSRCITVCLTSDLQVAVLLDLLMHQGWLQDVDALVLLSRRRSAKGGRLRHSCLHRDPLASQDDELGRERADTTGRAMLLR